MLTRRDFVTLLTVFPVLWECRLTRANAEDAPKGAYDKPGPYKVKTLEFPDLKDARRKDRQVPIKVLYPDAKGSFPLAIMSHGGAGTWDANLYQAQHLASHGYVVFCLEHRCSNNKRLAYYMSRAGGRMTFMQALHRITKDADAMLGRPKDVSFAIDQAIAWNESKPELKGRIDTKKVAMIGHSYGAYTTLVVCGARPILDHLIPAQNPPTGLAGDLSDPRVTFGFPMSPQPPGGTYFGEDSYKTINRPLVCLTGSKDEWKTSDGGIMPAERRLEVFNLLPPGEKYFFWLENADHMSFSDGPKSRGPFRTEATPDVQRISKALMVVSCDYYLKGKKEAADFIGAAYINSLCGKVVTKVKLMTK